MYRAVAFCALLLLLVAPSQTFALRHAVISVANAGTAAADGVGITGGAAARILGTSAASSQQVQPAAAAVARKPAAAPAKTAEAATPKQLAAEAKHPAAAAEKPQPAAAKAPGQSKSLPAAAADLPVDAIAFELAPELLSSTVEAEELDAPTNSEAVFILQDDAPSADVLGADNTTYTPHTGKAEKKVAAAQAKLAQAEERLRLQRYYQADPEAPYAEDGEGGDDSVSTYARPARTSSRAAKYASSALKRAQPSGVVEAQLPKQGLGGFAAGLFGNRNKAEALSTPKPSMKLSSADLQEGYIVDPNHIAADELSLIQDGEVPELYAGLDSASTRGAQLLAQGQGRPRSTQAKTQAARPTPASPPGKPLPGITMSASTLAALPAGSIAFNAKYPHGVVPAASDIGQLLAADPNSSVAQFTPHMRTARRLATFRTYNAVTSSFGRTGFIDGATPVFSGPVNVFLQSEITCGPTTNAVSVGRCTGIGIGAPIAVNATGSVLMTFSCELNPDQANICGTKWVPGMVLTAQGPVMVSVNDKNEITGINTGMGVTSLPIIGVYMPGKRTTLLADVANILSGVKGGSLNVKYVAATENGKISSGELTFFYDK